MSVSRIIVLSLLLVAAHAADAACPLPPEGLLEVTAERRPVDLEAELARPWQAGGEIVLYCAPDGTPRAGRLPWPPRDTAEELARRAEHFALARKLNFARKGEAHPLGLPMAPAQIALLERFALSDAGAVWLREVADDTLRLFNKGYLEYDPVLWRQAVGAGRMPQLSLLLTGKLTETALFAGDAGVFKFSGYAGPGAMAHPGAIGLGDAGLRCQFPSSEELVDPHAIISHEFGHTRYGDPSSAGSLLGEARTVERYENPVRVRNGYEPRAVYFQRVNQGVPEAQKGSLLERLLRLEKEQGISVADQTAVDRYHCDCPGPLPIILDCVARERSGGPGGTPGTEYDCKLNWRPEGIPAPPGQLLPMPR
ncbi:MAG TPA: hypothetical protein PLW81_09205 [Thiobacillaceae bacterium]|nr:hypothetical protein [Thiobacillaceae bacterium]